MHDLGVVLAGEDIARTAHVRRELIDLVKLPINDFATGLGVAEVGDQEIIGFRFIELWVFQIGTANPKVFAFETLDQMGAYKATGPANKSSFHPKLPIRHRRLFYSIAVLLAKKGAIAGKFSR
jgi:hypothetical protein